MGRGQGEPVPVAEHIALVAVGGVLGVEWGGTVVVVVAADMRAGQGTGLRDSEVVVVVADTEVE